jgi:hypothetical protein
VFEEVKRRPLYLVRERWQQNAAANGSSSHG